MDHQTFRSWILDEETLDHKNEIKLKEHLAECSECAQLKANLERAINMVRTAPEISAPPTFTARFTASLAERKREEERQQARNLTLALASSAIVIAFGAFLISLPNISLISLSAGLISSALYCFEFIQSIASFVTSFITHANPTSLLAVFVVVGGWILLASFTLALSIWKLAIKKVDIKK
jgi:hypothetical protein